MAEFKVYTDLQNTIAEMDNANEELDATTGVTSDNVSTLKTSVRYVEQHKNIVNIISLYKTLLLKDTGDLKELVRVAESLDTSISNQVK